MIFNPETKEVTGFIDSLKRIKEHYESNGPYDGIIGFSQGGYMVRTLMKADILGFPDLKLSPGFVILISSAIPYWDKIKPIIEGDYSSPVLYIYGSNDPITKPFDYCICPRSDTTVIFHKKGHYIPKFTDYSLTRLINFLNRFYHQKYGTKIHLGFTVDAKFKQNFIEHSSEPGLAQKRLHKI